MSDGLEGPFTPEEEDLMQLVSGMKIPTAIMFSDIAFNDPLQPQGCARCLHGAWMRMFEHDEDDALPSAFHFILFERTDAQMTNLIDGMARCRCADYPQSLIVNAFVSSFHEDGAEGQATYADDLEGSSTARNTHMIVSAFMRSFHDDGEEAQAIIAEGRVGPGMATPTHFHSLMKIVAVRILQTLKKVNPVKLAKSKGGKGWPTSLDDIILPSLGPDVIVKSLEQWIRRMTFTDPWPMELLGAIAFISRTLITPAIFRSPTAIPTIVRTAREICNAADPDLSPQTVETGRQFMWRIRSVAAFFNNVFLQPAGGPGLLDTMPTATKTSILQMSARVIGLLRSPLILQRGSEEKEERTSLTRDFMATLTLVLDENVSLEGIDPGLVQRAVERLDSTLHGPALQIIPLLLVAWKRSLMCYAMSCQESLQTSHTFKRCSLCKVVSYCGPECQRRAWRVHKPLCKIISKIISDGGGDLHSESFRHNCAAGKVDADDAQTVVDAYSVWRRTHGSVHI
ncbi:hypothetical protein C8R43DRAFT_549853 [Mycena crocata]|nr:hypothetical protein C8R43DRAFT_549853 [Mycena crocata]